MMYKKNAFLICIVLFQIHTLLGFSTDTYNAQRLIPAGHWVYDSIQILAMETGAVSFTQNAPLTIAELTIHLYAIHYDSLSDSGKAEFNRILDFFRTSNISFTSGPLSFSVEPSINPEFYYKNNSTLDWMYGYKEKLHILDFPLELSLSDFLYIESDIFAGLNYWAAADDTLLTNIPTKADSLDLHFPKRAYISSGIQFSDSWCVNFQLGSGDVSVGSTYLGSLILSKYFESDAYAQLSIYSPKIRYASTTMQLEVNKYMYLHRLEFRPIERLEFGLLEGVLVNAPFELRFLNPLTVFHSYTAWRTYASYNAGQHNGGANTYSGGSRIGSYLGLTVDFNPWKYMRVYGLLALNQFQTPYERKNFPAASAIPDSIGVQGGIDAAVPFMGGYLTGGVEALYTNPWLYISEDADWSFYRSRLDILMQTTTPINSWVGSPFGPDTIAYDARAGYKYEGLWSASLGYQYVAQGENSFNLFSQFSPDGHNSYYPKTAEEATLSSPTGIPEITNRMYIRASFNPLDWIALLAQVSYTVQTNSDHIEGTKNTGIELVFSTSLSIPSKVKKGGVFKR